MVVSIGLLTALLIFAIGTSVRMSTGIERTLQQMGGDIMVVPVGAVSDPDEFLFGSQRISLRMKRDVFEGLASMVGVDRAAAHTYLSTVPGLCCGVTSARMIAFNPEEDFVISPWMKKSIDRDLKPGEVVMGAAVEGLDLLETEGQAWILGKEFEVAGQLLETGTPLDATIFIREDDVRDVIEKGLTEIQVSPDEVSVVFLSLQKGFDIETITKTIEREYLQVKAISRGKIAERLKNFFDATKKIFALTAVMGSILALLVVGSVFSAVVNERRREVGIIRALGADKGHVLRLFIFEAFFTGIIGAVIGLGAGTALSAVMEKSIHAITKFPVELDTLQLLAINGSGMAAGVAVCILGALYPVVRINRLDPLDAIKESEIAGPSLLPAGSSPQTAAEGKGPMARVEQLTKSYFDGEAYVTAVDNVDFTLERGEFVTILGHSGSGKTTLLSIMGGLTWATSGSVTLDGTDISTLGDTALARMRNGKIGFIFQFASLIPTLTVLENVLFPSAFSSTVPGGLEERARELLTMVGLEDKIHAYPSQLSGGQQRRVAIARAFIMGPDVILADEPTGDLDVDTEREVMELVNRVHGEGMTIAMVTHEREITKFADRVVEMSRGTFV
jgi:ABC-type lipoprotein export system ATPase subunit